MTSPRRKSRSALRERVGFLGINSRVGFVLIHIRANAQNTNWYTAPTTYDYLRLPTTAYESRTNDPHPTTTHHLNPFTAPTDASTTATITINPSTIAQHIHFLVFRCETLAA